MAERGIMYSVAFQAIENGKFSLESEKFITFKFAMHVVIEWMNFLKSEGERYEKWTITGSYSGHVFLTLNDEMFS